MRRAIAVVAALSLGGAALSVAGCFPTVDLCFCPLDAAVRPTPNAYSQYADGNFVVVRGGADNGCTAGELDSGCVAGGVYLGPSGPVAPPSLS